MLRVRDAVPCAIEDRLGLGEGGAQAMLALAWRRHEHEPAQAKTGQGFHFSGEQGKFSCAHAIAALACFQVELNAHIERLARAKPAEALCDRCPVQCVNPLKVLCEISHLIALNATDEVPDETETLRRENFWERILHIIFAEISDTCVCRSAYFLNAARLGDCDQSRRMLRRDTALQELSANFIYARSEGHNTFRLCQ